MALAWAAAWGCYSSNAPPLEPDPSEKDDADLPIEKVDGSASCVPRKPWEGPGITAVVPLDSTTALVINGDRYLIGEFDTLTSDSIDPNVGRLVAWHETGLLRNYWPTAPALQGAKPWDAPGVTAAYLDKTRAMVIVNQYRRWVNNAGVWVNTGTGSIVDDLGSDRDAGPPYDPDGGRPPWQGIGVTALGLSTDQTTFSIFSKDRLWLRAVGDPDPSKWVWLGNGPILASDANPWRDAPLVGGKHPYDDSGITAVFYIGPKLYTFSADKLWVSDADGKVIRSGLLMNEDVWSTAPTVGCN